VAFSYRSIDRLILNAYIPTLQTPGAMAIFFRQILHKPILAGKVFKELTDRFVDQVKQFADQQRLSILRPPGRTRPGELAQKLLQKAERAGRWGVVAIVVHQEMARIFASTHAGGRATNFRVKEDRRLVNHYYFYLRDREYGDGLSASVRTPVPDPDLDERPRLHRPTPPSEGRVPRRGELHRRGRRPAAVQKAADAFNAELVEQIARRWLRLVPTR
jgi:hypothetical protein